jgi:predicted Zn-dependent protease
MPKLVRLGLTVGALVVSAWFALGWVQARDGGRANSLVLNANRVSPAQAAQVRSWLSSAGTLNPDRQVELTRAHLDFEVHDYGSAIRILQAVTRAEPQNVFAWSQLLYTAGSANRLGVAGVAARHVAQLVPKIKQR